MVCVQRVSRSDSLRVRLVLVPEMVFSQADVCAAQLRLGKITSSDAGVVFVGSSAYKELRWQGAFLLAMLDEAATTTM